MTTITVTGMPAPRLRLTARGRAVLVALVATPLVIVALLTGLNAGGATASDTAGAPLATVAVPPGGSLWALAQQLAPQADPRDVIAELVRVNRLASVDVQAGQQLFVPAAYSSH